MLLASREADGRVYETQSEAAEAEALAELEAYEREERELYEGSATWQPGHEEEEGSRAHAHEEELCSQEELARPKPLALGWRRTLNATCQSRVTR